MTDAHSDRVYFRHASTGEMGYLVRDQGRDRIKFDRPMMPHEAAVRDFHPSDWIPVHEVRPLTAVQVTQVCFEADKALCRGLGLLDRARAEWLSLKDEQRIAWMNEGPASPAVRQELYRAIRGVLEQHAGA